MGKSEHYGKRAPDGPWDDIVIGSGMGGLTAAAMLAKLGRRVLVLEQHYVPGGFTHTFRRKGFRFDVGVHAVGEVTPHSMTGRLLRRLTDGRLRWASLGPVYDAFHFPDGFDIDFPDSPARFRENLVRAFPGETRAIDHYLSMVRSVSGAMKGYYLSRTMPRRVGLVLDPVLGRKAESYFQRRTADVLAEITSNPRLRSVLASQWGYYGSPPSRSSFAIQALVAKHFMHGGYYPEGGSQAIAEELLRTVGEAGGFCRIRADVRRILVDGDRVIGVALDEHEEVRAERVFSAVGVRSTVERLLPDPHRSEKWAQSIRALPPAPAHVCLYLGFEGDIREAGASAANQWFYDTWDLENEAWVVPEDGPVPNAAVLYCSFPSLKDPHHDPGPKQRHTGEVVTFVPWSQFEPFRASAWMDRPEAYARLKQRMHDRLLEQFLERMPGLRGKVVFSELSTPLSTDHFVRPVAGSIYGLEPTPERFANPYLRARAPVKNLFFAGSEVATVGVIGAMMGGVLSVLSAEPKRAVSLLRG